MAGRPDELERGDTARMMTSVEVARILHVHSSTLRRWANRGLLKSYRINARGDRRFKPDDVARFLAEFNPHKGSAPKLSEGKP